MGVPCQWLHPYCFNIGAEIELGLALKDGAPPPKKHGDVVWATASTTHFGSGDTPSGTVNGPGGGAIKRAFEAKQVPHVCIVGVPTSNIAQPVVDFGYVTPRTASGSSKTIWASFSVKCDEGDVSVIGVPWAFLTWFNQRHCNNWFPMPSAWNVHPPSSVFVGMSAGDYVGSFAVYAVDGIKTSIGAALGDATGAGDALTVYSDSVGVAKLLLEDGIDKLPMDDATKELAKKNLGYLQNPYDFVFDKAAEQLGHDSWGEMAEHVGESNAESVDDFFGTD